MLTFSRDQPGLATGQPTSQTVWHVTVQPVHRTAPIRSIGMRKAEVMETMYEYVACSPTVGHLAILRTAHHRLLLRCIGWMKKRRDGYHMFDGDALAKTGCENVETTVRKRRILFAGFVAGVDNERLPKRVMFGEQLHDYFHPRGSTK